MDEYITRNNAISVACFGCNLQFSNKPCEPSECTIRQSIMALPTADVVPKSEVAILSVQLAAKEKAYFELQHEFETYKGVEKIIDDSIPKLVEGIKEEAEKRADEIERLKRVCNSYALQYGTVTDQQKVIDKAKAEVAREIFAEIERKVKASIVVHLEEINKEHIQDTPLYDRHSGIIFALRGMEDFIAELKKKYTEGESNG